MCIQIFGFHALVSYLLLDVCRQPEICLSSTRKNINKIDFLFQKGRHDKLVLVLPSQDTVLWPLTFKEACCEYFHCTSEAYERTVFWRALYRHALPLALLLYRRNQTFFKEDFDLIHELGPVKKPSYFTAELNFFHGRNVRDKTWLRGDCSIRVSGKRLIRIKNKVLRIS